ncbi:TetR family transcriptional regulator [Nocardia sp. NPDC003963]
MSSGVTRKRDKERTREEILDAATEVFAQMGYTGATLDRIADQVGTAKRMVYYYFGGKEQLFIAVLERAYLALQAAEDGLDVDRLDPVTAIRSITALLYDHHDANPNLLKLVGIENVHQAQHLEKSEMLGNLRTPALGVIEGVLERGRAQGVFVRRADPLDVHMMISAYCVFHVANRYTFRTLFGRDLRDPDYRNHYRAMIGDLVVSYLTTDPRQPRQE